MTEYHDPCNPDLCRLPWPRDVQRCFPDEGVSMGRPMVWHALGWLTEDLCRRLRRSVRPWLWEAEMGVHPLTRVTQAYVDGLAQVLGMIRIGEQSRWVATSTHADDGYAVYPVWWSGPPDALPRILAERRRRSTVEEARSEQQRQWHPVLPCPDGRRRPLPMGRLGFLG